MLVLLQIQDYTPSSPALRRLDPETTFYDEAEHACDACGMRWHEDVAHDDIGSYSRWHPCRD